jgi:tetratricopeptide (TPR) repeat protein
MRKFRIVSLLEDRWRRLPRLNAPARLKLGNILSSRRLRLLLQLKWWEDTLSSIVNVLLRLGAIFLMIILVVFCYRVLQDQGYAIEPFSVPKAMAESGYDGVVMARKLRDEVVMLKEMARSVKQDSVQLLDQNQPELDLAVMGIGVSLRSITYHLRELLGRKNLTIRGEVTQEGARYQLTLRMTGFAPRRYTLPIDATQPHLALEGLLRKASEAILHNLDPYRLAVICYREKRYDEAVALVRRILQERPDEAHWAYIAWGSILEEQRQTEAALQKFRRSVEIAPDFGLGWSRLAWAYNALNQKDKGIAAMRRAAALSIEEEGPDRWLNLGWMLVHSGHSAGADSAFAQAATFSKHESLALGSWLDSKITRGDTTGMADITRRLEAVVKDDANGYLMLALASMTRADTVRALTLVKEAFELDPSYLPAARIGIQAAYYRGDKEEAVNIYNRIDWSNANKAAYQAQQIHNFAAMSLNEMGRHNGAFEAVRKAIDQDPRVPFPYTTLAETFAFERQWDSCRHYMTQALRMGFSPGDFDLRVPPYPELMKQPWFRKLLEEGKLKG